MSQRLIKLCFMCIRERERVNVGGGGAKLSLSPGALSTDFASPPAAAAYPQIVARPSHSTPPSPLANSWHFVVGSLWCTSFQPTPSSPPPPLLIKGNTFYNPIYLNVSIAEVQLKIVYILDEFVLFNNFEIDFWLFF